MDKSILGGGIKGTNFNNDYGNGGAVFGISSSYSDSESNILIYFISSFFSENSLNLFSHSEFDPLKSSILSNIYFLLSYFLFFLIVTFFLLSLKSF